MEKFWGMWNMVLERRAKYSKPILICCAEMQNGKVNTALSLKKLKNWGKFIYNKQERIASIWRLFCNSLCIIRLQMWIQLINLGIVRDQSSWLNKWSHMRSKFMVCDLIVNAICTVPIQNLLFVRLVFKCATNHACVSKSNKVLMLGRTDVFSHFTPKSRSPQTTKGRRRADIHQKSMRTELSSIMHYDNAALPALEIPPDIWMQAWLRSLQVDLALCWDPIMIQCTLSSRETDCIARLHAPPELPASSGRYRNTKLSELDYFQVVSVAVAMFG
jgi:hypothetical protein